MFTNVTVNSEFVISKAPKVCQNKGPKPVNATVEEMIAVQELDDVSRTSELPG